MPQNRDFHLDDESGRTPIAVTDQTLALPAMGAEQRSSRRSRLWLVRSAAVGYSVAWIVGLCVGSSSTDVASSGSAIIREDTPQIAALALQFLLTEGVAALALLAVVIGLWRATARGVPRSITLGAGIGAVAISLLQTVLGVYLVEIAVREGNAPLVSSLTGTLNELDGLKMALLAVMALAISASRWRRQVRLPFWLLPTGIATGVALVVSAIGYLTRSNALSVAAWISLPLLLIYITASGLCVRRSSRPRSTEA